MEILDKKNLKKYKLDLFLVFSSFCFIALNANKDIKYNLLLLFYSIVSCLFINRSVKINILTKCLLYILLFYLIFHYYSIFCNKWSNSSIVWSIVNKFKLDSQSFLRYLQIILSIFSVYYVYNLVITVFIFLKNVFLSIKEKHVLSLFYSNIKKSFLRLIKCFLIVFISCCVGLFALTNSFDKQNENVRKNVKESAYIIKNEGLYPQISGNYQSQLDNWTDSIMLIISGYKGEESALDKALLLYRYTLPDSAPDQVLIEKYINNNQSTDKTNYARYWHGYLILLIPLLSNFNLGEIRIINGICQVLLILIIIFIFYKKKLYELIVPFIISYLMLCPPALASSLQYSSCFYVTLIGILLILLIRNENFISFIFLLIGILTSYFDLLTYPIVTIGLPLTIYVFINKNKDEYCLLFIIIKAVFFWFFGYGLMWFSKWIIATIFTNQNVLSNAFNSILTRISNKDINGGVYLNDVIERNVSGFADTPITYLFIIYVGIHILKIISIIKKYGDKTLFNHNKSIIIPYVFIFVLPFLWYIIATNHVAIHISFTGKACVVCLFSTMVWLNTLESKIYETAKRL